MARSGIRGAAFTAAFFITVFAGTLWVVTPGAPGRGGASALASALGASLRPVPPQPLAAGAEPPVRPAPTTNPKAIPTLPASPLARPFSGCNEARAMGRVNIPRGDPAYRLRMDGDRDGLACEPYRSERSYRGVRRFAGGFDDDGARRRRRR